MAKKIIRYRISLKKKKGKAKYKYIKDKSLKHFIYQHSKKENINFSAIKISSFLDELSKEENSFINKNFIPHFQFNTFYDIESVDVVRNFNSYLFGNKSQKN